MFDSDKSGFITKENLREVFTGQLSKEKELVAFERMLHEAGCSDSRGMNLQDFTKMVKNPLPVEPAEAEPLRLSTKLAARRTSRDLRDARLEGLGTGGEPAAPQPSAQNQSVHGLATTSTSSLSRTPTLHHDTISR